MTPLNVVGYLFAAAVTFGCIRYLWSGRLLEDLAVFKDRRPWDWVEMVVGDFLALAAVVACYFVAAHGPPFLQFSWLWLFATKDERAVPMNQMVAGATIPYFGFVFLILLILNLPRLAAAEEQTYRLGTRDWLHAIPRSLGFGLMHMVVGVPLWCGLALSIPGLWFTFQYFKGGVSRSTMAHTIYNLIASSFLLVILIDATLLQK